MVASFLALGFVAGLFSLASASPVTGKTEVAEGQGRYPVKSQSLGFRLVINATDPTQGIGKAVHKTYVASIHVGPGFALAGNVDDIKYGRIFYQNGTADEHRLGTTTIITDSGTPSFPSGLRIDRDAGSASRSTAHLDAGFGTPGIYLSRSPTPYAYLLPETWLACEEGIPYYQGQKFIILKQDSQEAAEKKDGSGDGCAPIRLIPECTELKKLAEGSYSSHEYAIMGDCYPDVKSIQW